MIFFEDKSQVGVIPYKRKFMKVFINKRDHNPPRVHIEFGRKSGSFRISDGGQSNGDNFSNKEQLIICDWIKGHRASLKTIWNEWNPAFRLDAANEIRILIVKVARLIARIEMLLGVAQRALTRTNLTAV